MRKYNKHSDDFKRSAVARIENETVPIVAASLSISTSLLYQWRDKFGSGATTKTSSSARIYWNEDELTKIAVEFVLLRSADVFESASVLFERAQRKAVPGDRQRDVPSIKQHKVLADEINRQWTLFLDKTPDTVATPPPPAPLPHIITLEIPRKLTAAEMLATLDEPTLRALLAAKEIARETAFHEFLRALAVAAGAEHLPPAAKFVPRLEAFDDGQKRTPRIAVVGVPAAQWMELQTEVTNAKLAATLRFPAAKDSLTIERSDFAIIYRGDGTDADALRAMGDRTIGQLGRDRVILIDDFRTQHLLQHVRNICSRQ